MELLETVKQYYSEPANAVTLLGPLLTFVFLTWWYVKYTYMGNTPRDALDWVRKGPETLLGIGPRGRLTKSDVAPMLAITLIYAAAALFYLGDTGAPQSYWRANMSGDYVLIDLGEAATIDSIYYYSGNFHGPDKGEHYTLSFSGDGVEYREQPGMKQGHPDTFSWHSARLNTPFEATRYILITAAHAPLELGELCITGYRAGAGERTKLTPLEVMPQEGIALFDEQELTPGRYGRTAVNGAYFDEIYHARAANEFMRGDPIYEITHPPLGKELIWAGIELFGMTPFGWRIVGTLTGILMLPLFYLFIKQLFGSTMVSTAATAVWAADFMHLTQTRIATIDVYNVFFVLLMFLFMHRWMTLPDDIQFFRTLPPLFMCGLSFGLGMASKWSCAFAGPALIVMYIWKLAARAGESRRRGCGAARFVAGTLGVSLLFFIAVPAVIYTLSYIPYLGGRPFTPQALWRVMWENQEYMLSYHTGLTDTHTYASGWYMWIADIRPVCYFISYDRADNTISVINAFLNPALAWGGFAAIAVCAADIVRRKSGRALFIVTAYLSLLLPWILIPRVAFMYHYFPPSVFLAAALAYVFHRIEGALPKRDARRHIFAFAAVCAMLFVMFYPALVALPASYPYVGRVLQWFPSWPLR